MAPMVSSPLAAISSRASVNTATWLDTARTLGTCPTSLPLPREGKKSLLVSGDNLVLVVNVQAQPTKLFRTGTAER